jgi:hypothetical protein
MDPLSISAGVAGFLSLAIEISKILTAYVGSVKSAPEEAQQLLQEVSALYNVSKQLAQVLRNDEVKKQIRLNLSPGRHNQCLSQQDQLSIQDT